VPVEPTPEVAAPSRVAAPSKAVPPETAPSASAPRRLGLGLFADYSHNALNWNAFALELRLAARPLRFLLLEAGVGGLSALDVKTDFGTARARGLSGLVSAAGCADPVRMLSLCGGARASLWWVQLRGSQARDAKPLRHTVSSVLLAALLQLRLSLLPRLILVGEASLGGALRGVRAMADGKPLLGNAGLVVTAALGLEVAL
jgi:hypothetical protein